MKPKNSAVTVLLSSLAILFSIVALCVAIPRASTLAVDYLGLLVGILALLVTVLIGWNIYTVIDAKNIREEQNNLQVDTFVKIQETCAQADHAVGDVFYRNLVGAKPYGDDYNLIYYRLSEISHLSAIGQFNFCEAIIAGLLETFTFTHNRHFSKSQMNNLYGVVAVIKRQNKIANFGGLMTLLSSFNVSVRP